MSPKTIHDIHKDYVNSGVSLIRESQGLENHELLQELLTELSQEYVKTVFDNGKRVDLSVEEIEKRKMLSSQELKQKFFEDLAKETKIDVKVKNARQLVEALFSEGEESPKRRDEDILKPRILGSVENIGTIILPPNMLEIVIGSGRGREQRETPLGFDKIGMVEERLSSKLSRERTTFHWKTGILNDNQMRKVSYYHLYLPEFDKTLLLNNQYGEGAFVVQGNFNIREARKSDLKGSSEAVMIKFDYEHPEEFLERLGIELNKKEFQVSILHNNQKITGIDNDKSKTKLTKEMVEEYFRDKDMKDMKELNQGERGALKIGGNGLVLISRLYGVKGDPLFHKEIWYDVLEKIYGESIERCTKKTVKEYFENKSLEDVKKLNQGERGALKIGGKGLNGVARLYDVTGNSVNNQEVWYNLLEKIYGEKIERQEKKEKLILTKEMVLEYFKNKKLEEMKTLTNKQRRRIEIGGNGLYTVASLYGIKGIGISGNQSSWYDFLEKVYGEKIERQEKTALTKEMVEKYFKNKSLEEMKNLTSKQRKNMEVGGYGLRAVSTLYEIMGDPNDNQEIWYDFLEKVYGKKIERQEKTALTKEMIAEHFKDKRFEEMINLPKRQKKELKIGGNGLMLISRLYGIKGDPTNNQEVWYDLLEQIYGVSIPRK